MEVRFMAPMGAGDQVNSDEISEELDFSDLELGI
jgi:hypothetical protein